MSRKIIAILTAALIIFASTLAFGGRISAIKKLFSRDTFEVAAESAYKRTVSEIVDSIKIKLPSDKAKQVTKSVVRSDVAATVTTAIAKPAEANDKVNVTVESNVDNPTVRIMNIREVYHDGIELKPGQYDIEVSKEGFRTSRFWAKIESQGGHNDSSINLNANLQPLGIPNCMENIELSSALPVSTTSSTVLQMKAVYPNEHFSNVYLAQSKHSDEANYARVIKQFAHKNYAEFLVAQTSSLSRKEMEQNKEIKIDPNEFVLIRLSYEQIGNDTHFTKQVIVPPLVIPIFTKKTMCGIYETT